MQCAREPGTIEAEAIDAARDWVSWLVVAGLGGLVAAAYSPLFG